MIREILLIHHSHTDIGYTHPQPAIFELHHRFIETALDLADAGQDDPLDSRFRWTCEVTGTTKAWWEQASAGQRKRFVAAVQRGQFEVAAMEWHMTPLADLRMILEGLRNVSFFRNEGVPVRSAMQTDVNGVPWGLLDALLDHSVTGFSMASNSHMGAPVHPRPGAFWWQSPAGRKLLCWNGFQYWHIANVVLGMPGSVEQVGKRLSAFLSELDQRGYTLPFLPLQITNPHHPDNAAPDPNIGSFVREWNARHGDVKIRTGLLSDVFDRLRELDLPTLKGDWTDYWNFGAGSSARETSALMEGERILDAAHELRAWSGFAESREDDHLNAAHRDLGLYAEHTWGADCSIGLPESLETHLQWALKSATAYSGLAHARIVRRDAMHRLAQVAGGEEPTLLLYNPLGTPVKRVIRLPAEGLDWALTPGVHHRQRLDGALGNVPPSALRWCEVDLPALGYRTYPVSSLPLAPLNGLEAGENFLASDRLRIEFDVEYGGVLSLKEGGEEYVGAVHGFQFGLPVLETLSTGQRRELMELDFSKFEPAEGWNPDWKPWLTDCELVDSESRDAGGAVEHLQRFMAINGDRIEVVYRLFANEPGVEIEVKLQSSGDASPYSLSLPFTLPQAGQTTWHYDTAGALVEFEKEQLPNAARHFVTARRFVRMATEERQLTLATPDLPLWKFGGMFFAPTIALSASDRQSVAFAWLANNYWEVNFLANQFGETRYRFRLLPGELEPVAVSVEKALPFAVPPSLHGYRELGPARNNGGSLMTIVGEGAVVENFSRRGEDLFLTIENLLERPSGIELHPQNLSWSSMSLAKLDGSVIRSLEDNRITLDPRQICGVILHAPKAPFIDHSHCLI